jgi:glycosyltransferase involved in cell wall biosynthesis
MKKRILLIVPLPPPMHGSNLINQHVVECKKLYEKFEVRVLPLHYSKSIADIGSFRIAKFVLLFRYLIKLLVKLLAFSPDLAYFVPAVTGTSFYRDCFFAALLKLFRVKTIYHLHGKGIKDKLSNPFLRRLYQWFFKDAFIIHLSPMLYEDIKNVAGSSQCRFLPNGIDLPVLTEAGISVVNNPPIFLFLSNLVLTKGPLIFLKACEILAGKGVIFKAYFAGNPTSELTEADFSQKIEKMGLSSCVEYIGPQYGEDKYNTLLSSDCFVFPTHFHKEAFPLVVLEAMAAGLPVISTQEGAIPEIVDDGVNGFIVEKNNHKDLAAKMEYLITHPESSKKIGTAGKNKFERLYTIERFHRNLVKIFDEIVS